LGIYDTTAGIDFILNKTGYSTLHMGGYSFGATICLIALAERPEYNKKIDKLVLIVPTARMKYYDRRLIIFKIFPYLFHVSTTDKENTHKRCNELVFRSFHTKHILPKND